MRATPGGSRSRTASKQVRFGDPGWRLGYARDAINSYFVFQVMKERGILPAHLRFQVSVPMVNSVLPPRIFPDQDDLKKIRPGFEAALRAEIAKIIEMIPAKELAIQWDCSTEVQDAYGAIPGYPLKGSIERNLGEVRALSPHIPADVALGYHFCFGTLGGWPRFQPDDLGKAVELANALIAASGRKVDWIHLPVLDRTRRCVLRAAQRPQAGRRAGLSRHDPSHGRASGSGWTVARKYLPEFGLGAYCGFGRIAPAELRQILTDHLEAVEIAGRA